MPDTRDAPFVLPEAVRLRVITLAANVLPALPPDHIPVPLRRFIRFTPARRAKLAAGPLAAALATDETFRDHVAEKVVEAAGDVGKAIAAGTAVDTADPIDVAAVAYVAHSPGWEALARAAAKPEKVADADLAVERVSEELRKTKASAKSEQDKLRKLLNDSKDEVTRLRSQLRETSSALRTTQRQLAKAHDDLVAERGRIAASAAEHDAAIRRLRTELDKAVASADAARATSRTTKQQHEARIGVLLSTVADAVKGLSTELGIDPVQPRPADLVTESLAPEAARRHVGAPDEVALLNTLLSIPRMHVIVDGYNVTKTAYPEIPLERQRARLVHGLAGLAAQSGAEITVVFDGTERLLGLTKSPRGVRVLFSRGDQIADQLIAELVRSEPPGRPLTVVSSDKEVVQRALNADAHTISSPTLAQRLSRG